MVDVLVYSGIAPGLSMDVVFRKMHFQNPKDVRNLNASIPNHLAGLSTAAENGFGEFGFTMSAENALLGSLERDWGSVRFGEKLNLSSPNYEENLVEINRQIGVKFFGKLQSDIKKTANQYREEIPESVQKIWEDFKPLLEKLNQPQSQFNKEDFQTFQTEYEKICEKYKSEDLLFTDNFIKPITTKINEILQKSTPTSDDIKTIKEQLGKHFDAALRIVNKTDMYHPKHQVMKYNEVHLPPLLQFIEGCFIVDYGKYDNIEKNLKIYKTIKDVREILFMSEKDHTAENFDTLTPEKKESFKIFFGINPDKELTFLVYKEKIDKFFENQTEYVNGIIKNLDNCKEEELKKENRNDKQIEEIEEIDKLKSNLLSSIDREKLPKLLEKPFLLQLFDSKSQTIKTQEELIKEIKCLSLTNSQKQNLALFYVGIGVLDFEESKTIITFNSLTIDELKSVLEEETNNARKKVIIETALEAKAIKDLDFNKLKEICGLVKEDGSKFRIIKTALEAKAITDLTVENLKEICGLVKEDGSKCRIIETALEAIAITDLDFNKLQNFCGLVGDDLYNKCRIINKALETKAIKDLDFNKLKEICGLVGHDRRKDEYKCRIIKTALEAKAIKDLTVENLKELCGLVEYDGDKTLIISKALESKALESKESYSEEQLTDMIMSPPPSTLTRVMKATVVLVCSSASKR